ncbi:MAG: crossover junction endodeoxyribonuclease RuvC [Verrucomicrobiae bacterium]|nr:crossover junction endodeoxyribonuclease RuvC [Verrucomicrobiae bacterium]
MKILGVDPSLRCTGYGLIAASGSACRAVVYGEIRNPSHLPPSECLTHIYDVLTGLIREHQPTALAVEGLVYVQNTRIAFTLGEVRGVILLAAAQHQVPAYEYAPRQVKQAVTGRGSAGKQQVAYMVKAQLGLPELPGADAADALALALCHVHRHKTASLTTGAPLPV